MTEAPAAAAPAAPAAPPEPTHLTDSQAQAQIEELISRRRGGERGDDGRFKPKDADKPAEEPAQKPAQKAEEAEEPVAEGEDEPKAEAGEDDAQEAEQGADEADAEDSDDIEIEEGGKKYKVPKALADGAMRQQQFSREMTRLAEQDKVIKAREAAIVVREAITAELAPAIAQVQNTERVIESLRAQMPDPRVDANAYLLADKQVRDLEAGLKQLQAAVAQRGTELAQQHKAAQADLVQKGYAQVARDIPRWKDDAFRAEVFNFGVSRGYTPDELNSTSDPRLISLIHDAMQYRRVRDAQPAVRKKLTDAAPVVRPTGSVNQASSERERAKEAAARVKKTGSSTDAEAAVLALLRAARKR